MTTFNQTCVSFCVCLFAASFAIAQPVDKEQLAQRIVLQSAGVREGDRVLIVGGSRDVELLENIATDVQKAGAHPLLVHTSDRLARKSYTDVPAKYDAIPDAWNTTLAGLADVMITIDSNENPGLLADIAPERIARRGRASASVFDMMRARGVRQVNLGNGMYPSAANAKQFGVSEADLSRMFWSGVSTDAAALSGAGDRVRRALAYGRELQITNPGGTNLRLRVDGQPVRVSDGSVSPEALARGEKTQVWLPAGEAFFVPVAGSAEGKIVVPRYMFQGKPVENLTLTVKGGRVTNMTASSGLEPLRASMSAAGEGSDVFSVVDLGLNPNVMFPSGSHADTWVPAGTVTLVVGNNTWAGGDNNTAFGLSAYLPGSTVTIDGKPIVENGTAKF
jgi:leucyl aminopeptidase (aminopeptidase T)